MSLMVLLFMADCPAAMNKNVHLLQRERERERVVVDYLNLIGPLLFIHHTMLF